MPKAKKIHVLKNDEAAAIAEKLMDLEADEVVISVPKFAKLSESVKNFHLLKREAEMLNKKIVIESIDDNVMELCKKTGLECVNPFFTKPQRKISDIVMTNTSEDDEEETEEKEEATKRKSKKKVKKEEVIEEIWPKKEEVVKREPVMVVKRRSRGHLSIIGVVMILIVLGTIAAFKFLPKAEVTIVRAKEPWRYENTVIISKLVSDINENGKVPGQIFVQKNNLTVQAKATGKKNTADKAKGKVLLYNAFSSEPQVLVQRTRLSTTDGKIFRLIKGITVPGATIKDSKIIPSSIEVEIEADQAGEQYNVGVVDRFTIPGFAGTPKFQGFYGVGKDPILGGAVGERVAPTDQEIEAAKAEGIDRLRHAIRTALLIQLRNFVLPKGDEVFKVTRQVVDPKVDANNQFSVLTEGEIAVMGFKEDDLKKFLLLKGREAKGADLVIKEDALTYGTSTVNMATGEMQLPLIYESYLVKDLNADELKTKIAGKSETDLKEIVTSLPGLERTDILLWPFWVRSVPTDLEKIHINID